MTTRTSTNFWLDLISLIVMIGLAATGGLIHFVLPAGTGHFLVLFGWNRHDIGEVHFYLAVAAVVLLALHVLLHWNWICCVIAKMLGRSAPSRKSQTTWGVALLLGLTILLAGGLYAASTLVQGIVSENGGRGRRANLDNTGPIQNVAREIPVRASAPMEGAVQIAEPPSESSISRRSDGQGKHIEECPAGASINGRISLMEAASICRLSVAQLTERLGLPPNIDPREHLGRLKRRYGLDLHTVRRLACR